MPRQCVRSLRPPLLPLLLGLLAASGSCAPVYVSSSVSLAGALKDGAVSSVVVGSPKAQARHARHQLCTHTGTETHSTRRTGAGPAVLLLLQHPLHRSRASEHCRVAQLLRQRPRLCLWTVAPSRRAALSGPAPARSRASQKLAARRRHRSHSCCRRWTGLTRTVGQLRSRLGATFR